VARTSRYVRLGALVELGSQALDLPCSGLELIVLLWPRPWASFPGFDLSQLSPARQASPNGPIGCEL